MTREHPTKFPTNEECDEDDSRPTGSTKMIKTIEKKKNITVSLFKEAYQPNPIV